MTTTTKRNLAARRVGIRSKERMMRTTPCERVRRYLFGRTRRTPLPPRRTDEYLPTVLTSVSPGVTMLA